MENAYYLNCCYSTLCIILLNDMMLSKFNVAMSSSILFFMKLVKTTKAKATMMEEKVANADNELCEAETHTAEVEG